MIPIDAYTFRREIDRFVDKYGHINMTITQFMTAVEHSEVDAVPVIRCKDCEFFRDGTDEIDAYCSMWGYSPTATPDGYCSDAERRECDATD